MAVVHDSPLGDRFQACEPLLELSADQAIHIEDDLHDFPQVRHLALHRPGDLGDIARGLQSELHEVVTFDGLRHVQADAELA
jgi:hypothetical protein